MPLRSLQKRATQLELLSDVCAAGSSGRLRLRRDPNQSCAVRFVAARRRQLLLDCEDASLPALYCAGQPVEVGFEHRGAHFRFFAVTASTTDEPAAPAANPLWLNLPLRVEAVRRRQWPRLALESVPHLLLEFTHAVSDRRRFSAHLRNVSAGGLGTFARVADVGEIYAGDLFSVRAVLPGVPDHDEFVVRLVHLRPVPGDDQIALGWVLQPGDDPRRFEAFLNRLEQYVAQYRQRRSAAGEN